MKFRYRLPIFAVLAPITHRVYEYLYYGPRHLAYMRSEDIIEETLSLTLLGFGLALIPEVFRVLKINGNKIIKGINKQLVFREMKKIRALYELNILSTKEYDAQIKILKDRMNVQFFDEKKLKN